jgi:hypothetical protein
MERRRTILALLLAGATATGIAVWPARPAYVISSDNRTFLSVDVNARQLLTVMFDEDSSAPPTIERRDVVTGRLMSATPLDWADVVAEVRQVVARDNNAWGSCFHISADCTTLNWSETIAIKGHDRQEDRSADFDTTTGRRLGPIRHVSFANCEAWSPDGRWMLMPKSDSSRQFDIIDTRSGQPLMRVEPPSGTSSSAHGCFAPDSRHLALQWSDGAILYQINLDTRSIERTYRLMEYTTNADNDNVWETVAEWRPGELRTELTYCAVGTTQFFDFSFRHRTSRHRFDGEALGEGQIDPLLDDNPLGLERGSRGEGDGWVARAVIGDGSESMLSQWLGVVESRFGRGLLVNWRGRFGTRYTVRIIDRASNAVRYEYTQFAWENSQVVLDGSYVLLMTCGRMEVWRTDVWPRWLWATAGGIGMLAAMMILARIGRAGIQRFRRLVTARSLQLVGKTE